jgi:hypothetical protein
VPVPNSNSFQIENYTVSAVRGPGPSYRIIILTGVELMHGIRHGAEIYFYRPQDVRGLGDVSNVDQPNFNGQFAIAFFPLTDYWEIYDILRSERPVFFRYTYEPRDRDRTRPGFRDLITVWVNTGPEPPGQGPADLVERVPAAQQAEAAAQQAEPLGPKRETEDPERK